MIQKGPCAGHPKLGAHWLDIKDAIKPVEDADHVLPGVRGFPLRLFRECVK